MELPPSHILVKLQRVCRWWQAVINGSVPIQQSLFFKPIRSNDIRSIPVTAWRYDWNYHSRVDSEIVCLHPALITLLLERIGGRTCHDSYKNEGASWRRGLLSQPEFEDLTITLRSHSKGRIYEVKAPPGGFTLDFAAIYLLKLFPLDAWRWPSHLCAWKKVSAKEFLGQIKGEKSPSYTSDDDEDPLVPALSPSPPERSSSSPAGSQDGHKREESVGEQYEREQSVVNESERKESEDEPESEHAESEGHGEGDSDE